MVSNLTSRLKVAQTDEKLTSFGGLALVGKCVDSLGLAAALDGSLCSLKRRVRGYRSSEAVLSLVLLHIAGGDCLDDVRRLEGDPCARRLLGSDRLPSANTLGTYLRRFGHREIATLAHAVWDMGKRSLDQWSREDSSDQAVIDFDSSLIEAKKREARKTYKGFRGYNPLLATVDGAEIVLAGLFRDGNASPSSHAMSFLRRCLDALPDSMASRKLFVRSDSAWYRHDVLDECNRRGVRFTVTADMNSAVLRACRRIQEWETLGTEDDEPREEIGETVYAVGDDPNSPAYRLVVCRRWRAQGDLWDGEYRYHAIVTNVSREEMSAADILFFHRRRGDAENILKELKGGYGMDTMPCGTLLANAAYFQTILLAYNLMQWLKRAALPDAWRPVTIKTLRFRLLSVAGRLVHHARSWTLKLPRTYPFYSVFSHALWEIGQLRV